MKEKLGLAFIFSIVWITIATAIVRAAETGFRSINDPVLLSLKEVLETSIGKLPVSLPSDLHTANCLHAHRSQSVGSLPLLFSLTAQTFYKTKGRRGRTRLYRVLPEEPPAEPY